MTIAPIAALLTAAVICHGQPLPGWPASLQIGDVTKLGTPTSTSRVPPEPASAQKQRIHWGPMIGEQFLYMGVKVGIRLSEKKTRDQLDGPFFSDWGKSVSQIEWGKWSDGGKTTANYIGHPMDGSISGYIYRRNDDRIKRLEIDLTNGDYVRGLLKSLAAAAVVSTLSEIGPLSEASIGNVGLKSQWWLRMHDGSLVGPVPEDLIGLDVLKKSPWWERGSNATGLVDFVVTPAGGIAVMMFEDALDKYAIKPLERRIGNRYMTAILRSFLNPTRSAANMLSFSRPWNRDSRP